MRKRDIERILNLYAPNAKLNVNVEGGIPIHGTVEDVIVSDGFLNISTEFFEREISRDMQRFGNMAQIISTYGISDAMENRFPTVSCRGSLVDTVFVIPTGKRRPTATTSFAGLEFQFTAPPNGVYKNHKPACVNWQCSGQGNRT